MGRLVIEDEVRSIHEPLRAKRWKGQPWRVAQVKLDGYRFTTFVGCKDLPIDKRICMFGKDHREHLEFLNRFPRLRKTNFFKSVCRMPPLSSVESEIIVPGGKASDVPTALRNPKMPMAIISFGFPRLNGQDRSEKSLVWAENIASTYGFVFAEWYELEKLQKQLNFKLSDGIEIVRKRLLELAKKLNYEGFVLKDTQYGKWYKVKHSPSVDCIVTDVSEGKDDKKYSGQVGALVVSLLKSKKLVEIANVSGMTESERLEMTELWKSKKLMGKVVEVTYQEVGARGRLRHPRFSRFRPDKPVRDCTWDQLEENC